jgi:hypothetical protein
MAVFPSRAEWGLKIALSKIHSRTLVIEKAAIYFPV